MKILSENELKQDFINLKVQLEAFKTAHITFIDYLSEYNYWVDINENEMIDFSHMLSNHKHNFELRFSGLNYFSSLNYNEFLNNEGKQYLLSLGVLSTIRQIWKSVVIILNKIATSRNIKNMIEQVDFDKRIKNLVDHRNDVNHAEDRKKKVNSLAPTLYVSDGLIDTHRIVFENDQGIATVSSEWGLYHIDDLSKTILNMTLILNVTCDLLSGEQNPKCYSDI